MSKLNWRRANLDSKRSVSVIDDEDYRARDAASRWLELHVSKPVKSNRAKPANGERRVS